MASEALCRIVTERLVLRDFEEADLPGVHAFRSDPLVARFMDFAPETLDQSDAWLKAVILHNRKRPRIAYNLAIERRATAEVIGWIGIGDSERHPAPGECGFGYLVQSAHWGQGYATEAVQAILAFGFRELGAERISAWCSSENVASARVLTKAGLTLSRRYQDTEPKSSATIDCLEYQIMRVGWETLPSPPM